MGAAARKPASTAPAKAAEDMSAVASALRGNAGFRSDTQGTPTTKHQGKRAQGVLSDDVDPLVTDRSDVERRAPDVALSTPERTAVAGRRASRSSEKAQLTPVSVLENSED